MSKIKNRYKLKREDEKAISHRDKFVIKLDEIPEPDFDMKYHKADVNLIKYITETTRKTPELRSFMSFVKTYLDVSKCTFFDNYSMKNGYIIELHHCPFTLFDICEAVAKKRIEEKGYIELFSVVEEVLQLHFRFFVGLTPLNPTAHDLVHAEELRIPPSSIIGEWDKLYALYFPYLSQSAIKKYDEIMKPDKEMSFPKILKLNPVKIEVEGVSNRIDEREMNTLFIKNKIDLLDSAEYRSN
jgi:hypothetical protein